MSHSAKFQYGLESIAVCLDLTKGSIWHQLLHPVTPFPKTTKGPASFLPGAQHSRRRTRIIWRLGGLAKVFYPTALPALEQAWLLKAMLTIPVTKRFTDTCWAPTDTGHNSRCLMHLDSVLPEKSELGQLPKGEPENHGGWTHQDWAILRVQAPNTMASAYFAFMCLI